MHACYLNPDRQPPARTAKPGAALIAIMRSLSPAFL
jgi:hypothetical protein